MSCKTFLMIKIGTIQHRMTKFSFTLHIKLANQAKYSILSVTQYLLVVVTHFPITLYNEHPYNLKIFGRSHKCLKEKKFTVFSRFEEYFIKKKVLFFCRL